VLRRYLNPESVGMKPWMILLLVTCLAALAGCSQSSDTAEQEVATELPPMIDRELFFGDPEISGSNLSPDGQFVSFLKPYNGVRNIWVKGIDEPFESAKPVTADERPVPGYFWSRDGEYVLYVQDKGGNENFHVYAVDPAASPDADTGVPSANNLTPLEGVRAIIYSVPKNQPDVMIVGLNDRDPRFHDIYKIDIATGERSLMLLNEQGIGAFQFDLEGNPRMAIRQLPDGGTELLRIDSDGSLTRVYQCTYEENAYPVRYHKDGKRVYLITNKGEDVDLTRLVLLDPETSAVEVVESDPEGQVDFGGPVFSEATDELIATVYVGDRQRIYPKTEQVKRDLKIFKNKLPAGSIFVNGTSRDMNLMLVAVSTDVDPGSVYLYDRRSGEVKLQYRSRPDLPSENLAPCKVVRYQARDGLEIPAILTLPRNVEPKNLPVVVFPHGGPWARDVWGYDPYAQFLANRGYAVLQPNFRGSTGYGKAFANAANKTWGTGAAQHDITDGAKWLIEEGIADPERIGIFGGSYGGYATLCGVTFTPDLYACGVPYVAPSNLITLIESFPEYWKPWLEGSWFKKWGNPEIESDRLDLIERSPLFKVDQIECPLLVVHGANDPRVKQHEADQIVVALRLKNKPVEYIVAPDEGHGYRAPNNRKALAVAMEKFLAKHLGGRFQTDVQLETAKRLAEITVDVSEVKDPGVTAPHGG
jgi:dipeptidyl aminopeptidase/acylaminoacyl peptidase